MAVIRPNPETRSSLTVHRGKPFPLGATITPTGVRFVVFSRHATAVTLLLYDGSDPDPAWEVDLDARVHRTGDLWHAEIEGLGPGQLYALRVHGPLRPERGHRFNAGKLLLDPCARAFTGVAAWDLKPSRIDLETGAGKPEDGEFPRCIVIPENFDWKGDRPPRVPLEDSVIYEMHVRGFTRHETSGVLHPGTFRGVVEKIPYLKDLGVTAVELLPVHEFNENEIHRFNPLTEERLKNYWGYSTVGFFAPKGTYAASGTRGEQVGEFKSMVHDLHEAGIEVILDVVFNHTAEGGIIGSTFCFRGLENRVYYMLEEDRRTYMNFTGCGNTVNCNHPVVMDFILDCLRYWVMDMHVDGFRFDLASVLARGPGGDLLENPPLVERIAEDPLLKDTKIIAEAWDAAGAYQVGSFHGSRWAEWNGRYRDDVRRFWRGDAHAASPLATRIAGSSDLYQTGGRRPYHSINFLTSHDGFTLRDLVSYASKHNEANGEWNRDGDNHEISWNNGVEGETSKTRINRLRRRQVKSLLATLLVSQGVPMLLSGDEFYRTQGGNNNTYCQDNATSWLDWRFLEKEADLHRFVRGLIAFRKRHPGLRRPDFFRRDSVRAGGKKDIVWLGPGGKAPDWSAKSRSLACLLDGDRTQTLAQEEDADLLLIFHNDRAPVDWKLPAAPGGARWLRVVDTGREAPHDFLDPGDEAPVGRDRKLRVAPGAVVVLMAPRR